MTAIEWKYILYYYTALIGYTFRGRNFNFLLYILKQATVLGLAFSQPGSKIFASKRNVTGNIKIKEFSDYMKD